MKYKIHIRHIDGNTRSFTILSQFLRRTIIENLEHYVIFSIMLRLIKKEKAKISLLEPTRENPQKKKKEQFQETRPNVATSPSPR